MAEQKKEERRVFHLLHGKIPGVAKMTSRISDGQYPSEVVLPKREGVDYAYEIQVDPRDERVLIVWDGALLPNGLPRGSTIIHQATLCNTHRRLLSRFPYIYEVSWGQAYKKRETDNNSDLFLPQYYKDISGAEFGIQEIERFFVLMRSDRTATVLRFDDKRLAPRYVFVEVERGGKSVRWRQSSY